MSDCIVGVSVEQQRLVGRGEGDVSEEITRDKVGGCNVTVCCQEFVDGRKHCLLGSRDRPCRTAK